MMVWDSAPVHHGRDNLGDQEAFPTLTLCLVEQGTTSICQPLDRPYFRAIKACLRRQFCGVMAEVLNKLNPIGQLVDKPTTRSNILHLLHAALQYAHTVDGTATAWKHLLVPDEELPALLAKAREEHSKGNLFENNSPDFDNAADEDPERDDLHEDEVQDGCMKEAEEEEAPAEPSPLPAADVKEPVAFAPEQALKPAQRMCKFLALRLAFGNPSAPDLHKAAPSGSSGSSSSAERVS